MLTNDPMIVTIAEADAYCTARGIADWTGIDALKTAALRRAQDYIAGKYNGRWTYMEPSIDVLVYRLWRNATAPEAVKLAVIEAATREIKVPFSLTPDLTPGREKVLTGVKGITWTPLSGGTAGLRPVLSSIEYLLNGYVIGGGLGGGAVPLMRS